MKKTLTLLSSLILFFSANTLYAAGEQGSLVSINYASDDVSSSLRFETVGDMTEIKNCQTPLSGASAQLISCQSLGVFNSDELADILEAGWIESILADTKELGAAVSGGTAAAVVVYMALNKLSKGLISKPSSQLLMKEILPMAGLISANFAAGLTGAAVGNEAFDKTEAGRNANEIDHRNAIASDLRSGNTDFTAEDEFIIPELVTFILGKSQSLKAN